ncbi:YitT family protein, partial [Xenorhabdus sp. 12]|nr:YitT family protein [Xenorhabdus sp. 12]
AFTILSIAVQAKTLDLIYYPKTEKKAEKQPVSIPMSKKHATN